MDESTNGKNVFVAYLFFLVYKEKELASVSMQDLKFYQDFSEAAVYVNNAIQGNLIGSPVKHREKYVITGVGQEVTVDSEADYEPRLVEKYGVIKLSDFEAFKSTFDSLKASAIGGE